MQGVYLPDRQQAGAYFTHNALGTTCQTLSIAGLERCIGITVFPKRAPEIKANKRALPVPTPHGRRGSKMSVKVEPHKE